jgi:hypothetical protein
MVIRVFDAYRSRAAVSIPARLSSEATRVSLDSFYSI